MKYYPISGGAVDAIQLKRDLIFIDKDTQHQSTAYRTEWFIQGECGHCQVMADSVFKDSYTDIEPRSTVPLSSLPDCICKGSKPVVVGDYLTCCLSCGGKRAKRKEGYA